MKKYSFCLFLLILSILSGCGGGKRIQKQEQKNSTLAMPLAQEKKDSTMLSFFDEDVNAFEDIETFVLDEDSPTKEDSIKIAHADTNDNSFNLQEPQHVDREKAIVYFDYDSNQIRDDQKTTVQSLKKQIRQWIKKGYKVVFRGHCCQWSPKADGLYNMILSNERAVSLANMLEVPEEKRTIVGLGYEEPLVLEQTRTKAGQAPNRRVEIYPITV